ncbi:hypothetical protein [Weissella paramesenteroides]|uniref:hypothetical protein n=1 Tax=Weissella paramesenteroides TaxID=1249 RepID=UPI00123B6B78|nr:hypothetical protein [Weissella paramesenteroides]KAA8455250.1 hypothetical protein FKV86_08100 [Weissella paramesenteroides]KAA8456289.1 hypothetical protein FKV78_08425 [Weissella paramesenteroides]KAA8458220.1 hypothetical protein FKV82_07260 [Weissella paramesenteroides]KAA8460211.1 hypothetical protein FKV80_08990 [Weissella paramesenteroides]KAA8461553.1 hypothetical protein FKV85_07970 [Weissella paramesenteroides]
MPKYQKKPVEIEAVQYDGTLKSVLVFIDHKCTWMYSKDDLKIKTLEGDMKVNKNDYIIKGVHGEFYPCKPDIFEETYVKVG